MSFLIYNTNNGTDVTNDLIEGSLRIQDRCDSGIAQGSCQLYTSLIEKNIPPYTLCSIEGVYYFISSEASEDMQNDGYWSHDCTIVELTAILQCYILGTKCFSAVGNHTDKTKIDYIIDIIETKYGNLNFTFNVTMAENHEFYFGAGTTMLQAITEIMSWYNFRPIVTAYSVTNGTTNITISNRVLDGSTTFDLQSGRIITKTYRQSVDDYGAILESETQNVVDRTNLTTFKRLTCTSEDILFNADTAIIKLPCRVEKITKFQTRAATNTTIVTLSNNFLNDNTNLEWYTSSAAGFLYIIDTFDNFKNNIHFRYESTYTYLNDDNDTITEEITGGNIANAIWEGYYKNYFDYDEFKSQKWIVYKNSTSPITYRFKPFSGQETASNIASQIQIGQMISDTPTQIGADTVFNLRLLEKAEWDTKTAQEQTTYAVYDTGGDKIYNLNAYYKNDLWNIILGNNRQNFLYGYSSGTNTETISSGLVGGSATITHIIGALSNSKATELQYDIECIPITNPVIMDIQDMSTRQVNEASQKKISKSYQNSSSIISFDNVIDGIKKTNQMLGQPEIEIEYDSTDANIPNPTNKITVDDFVYYVMAVTTEYHKGYRTSYINLCSSYSKIADAIGVESQYHSTRLPVDTIVERPICINSSESFSASDIAGKNLFVYFWFANERQFYIRPTVMIQGNKIYFYAEFEDNYSAGKTLSGSYSANTDMQMVDTPYGDANNECGGCYIGIDYKNNISRDQSYSLPKYDSSVLGSRTSIYSISSGSILQFKIHKDTREKLTFTIICNYTN